jgi:hypothetical protein
MVKIDTRQGLVTSVAMSSVGCWGPSSQFALPTDLKTAPEVNMQGAALWKQLHKHLGCWTPTPQLLKQQRMSIIANI